MKRILLVLLVVSMAFVMGAGAAVAVDSQINVSHTITGYTPGADTVTLDVILHLENTGETQVDSLTLSLVPFMVLNSNEVVLHIGTLGPYETLDVTFTIVTPVMLSLEEFSVQPLFWESVYNDDTGNFFATNFESMCIQLGGESCL